MYVSDYSEHGRALDADNFVTCVATECFELQK